LDGVAFTAAIDSVAFTKVLVDAVVALALHVLVADG
jgi:hypothetical protein